MVDFDDSNNFQNLYDGESITFSCQDPNDVLHLDGVVVPDTFQYTCRNCDDCEDIDVHFNLSCGSLLTHCDFDFADLASTGVLAYQVSTSIQNNFLTTFPVDTNGMYSVPEGEIIVFSCIEPGQDLLKDDSTLFPNHIDLDFYPYMCDPADTLSETADFRCVNEGLRA